MTGAEQLADVVGMQGRRSPAGAGLGGLALSGGEPVESENSGKSARKGGRLWRQVLTWREQHGGCSENTDE